MSHHTLAIDLNLKKDHSQKTFWMVKRQSPYPSIPQWGSKWENHQGLLPHQGNPPMPLDEYHCYLVPSLEVPENWNRTNLAGYVNNGKTTDGAFVFRGQSSGEMTITFNLRPRHSQQEGYECTDIKVNGFSSPTPAFRDFVRSNVVPVLLEYIRVNKVSLTLEAKETLLASMQANIADERKRVNELEAQIAGMVEVFVTK